MGVIVGIVSNVSFDILKKYIASMDIEKKWT